MLDKEEGMTSRKIDNILQKRFSTSKVGHLGTLDPFATGLLLIAIGKGTKCLPYLDSSRKTYVASLSLGEKTSTGDKDGEVVCFKEPSLHEEDEIRRVLDSFLGKSLQLPPMSSAIKVDGVPLYKYSHKGIEKERKPRPIEVFSIRLLSYSSATIVFEVEVSSGTYIRTLGEDIASRLGELGHLIALRRTKVGEVKVEDAKKLGEIGEGDIVEPTPFLNLSKIEILKEKVQDVYNGKKMLLEGVSDPEVALLYNGIAMAVYQKEEDGLYASKRGLF